MATGAEHISTWKRNRKLLESGVCPDHPEWRAVFAFYCALHAVEALLAGRPFPRCRDHMGRNDLLAARENKLLVLWTPYKVLFDASLDARYACPDFDKRFSPPVLKDLVQGRLQAVEGVVIRELRLERREFPLLDVDAASGRVTFRSTPPRKPD